MSLLDAWLLVLVLAGVALFAFGSRIVFRLAGRHAEDDPRGRSKALAAVAFSVLLAAAGILVVQKYEAEAADGIHATLTSNLNQTLGDATYWSSVQTVAKRLGPPAGWPGWLAPQLADVREPVEAYIRNHPETNGTIPSIILPKLRSLNATLDAYFAANPGANETSPGLPAHVRENLTARVDTLVALGAAYNETFAGCPAPPATSPMGAACLRARTPNHLVWLRVEALLAQERVDEAEAEVRRAIDPATVTGILPLNEATAATNAAPCKRDTQGRCAVPLEAAGLQHGVYDAHELRTLQLDEGGPAAFAHKHEFDEQMHAQLAWLVYPSLIGLVVAPFAFAGGSILRAAFVPSDTVGFRPYPGKAAGWFFLILGISAPLVVLLSGYQMPPILDIFSLLAIPLGAWLLRDLAKRSAEGQIAL